MNKYKDFIEWMNKNRNYDITVNEYINNSGTKMLYKDSKYMLTKVDTAESTAIASVPTQLCLAFPTDKSMNFENPIDEFLEHFFIYPFHIIENCEKMHETELFGITVFKNKKKYHPNIRYWPPSQGTKGDIYYIDLDVCIRKENMNRDFLKLPKKIWDILYTDIEEQRKLEKK